MRNSMSQYDLYIVDEKMSMLSRVLVRVKKKKGFASRLGNDLGPSDCQIITFIFELCLLK